MSEEFAGADTGEETEGASFAYEDDRSEEEQLRDLEFRPLDGRFRLECTNWRHYDGTPKDGGEPGEPAIIFDFTTVDNPDHPDNDRQISFFAPITGPRKGDLAKVFIALTGVPKPKVVDPTVLDSLKGCITEGQIQSAKIKRGDRRGQRVNRLVDFYYGQHGSSLQEWLEDRRRG